MAPAAAGGGWTGARPLVGLSTSTSRLWSRSSWRAAASWPTPCAIWCTAGGPGGRTVPVTWP
eukprot:3078069-Lingulodinium_polyedra.AAC.1